MKVLLAETLGMCFGVKRALDLTLEAGRNYDTVATIGPLVHNNQVTERLQEEGIQAREPKDVAENSAVVIRSHGVGPQVYRQLNEKNCRIIEGTCPFVAKALRLAQKNVSEGYHILILGDPEHAEVQGYMQWLAGNCTVVSDVEADLAALDLPEKISVIAQTTENMDRLQALEDKLRSLGREPLVHSTICNASQQRRQAAELLARQADLVLVIGGKHSANTTKLGEYCRRIQPKTYIIESYKDIDLNWLKGINLIGITAGASTPEWIIKEVVDKMQEFKDQVNEQIAQNTEAEQEMDFSEMEAQMACREFHAGDVVKGTVVKVSSDEVLVDIGYKSEGIIPAFELAFTKIDPQTFVQVGDVINAEVVKEDHEGNIILSRKNALFEEKIDHLEKAFANGEPVEATVIDVVKGGLLVDVGMRGFVPASHVERGYVKDLNEYLKKTMLFKIIELNRGARKVILSRKALLEENYQKQKEVFWNSITEGETRKGVVKRLTDFGAFVDIGGCDGLLHVSEMGWGKVAKPSDVVAIDDEIEVYVLKVDREKEKVSLSLKQMVPNPWTLANTKYLVGEIYPGTVMRTAAFGAFIQLEPGLEGLAHISQLAKFRVNKVDDVLKAGQEIMVKILDIDMEKKRISLSVKEAFELTKPESGEASNEVEKAPAETENAFAEASDSAAEAATEEATAEAAEDKAEAAEAATEGDSQQEAALAEQEADTKESNDAQ
jgi:small subunit ribosomal protein S1